MCAIMEKFLILDISYGKVTSFFSLRDDNEEKIGAADSLDEKRAVEERKKESDDDDNDESTVVSKAKSCRGRKALGATKAATFLFFVKPDDNNITTRGRTFILTVNMLYLCGDLFTAGAVR